MVFSIMCVGMTVVTVEIRVRRPAIERAEAFQLATLERSLSMRKLKALVFCLLGEDGGFEIFSEVTASSHTKLSFGSRDIVRKGMGGEVNLGF